MRSSATFDNILDILGGSLREAPCRLSGGLSSSGSSMTGNGKSQGLGVEIKSKVLSATRRPGPGGQRVSTDSTWSNVLTPVDGECRFPKDTFQSFVH